LICYLILYAAFWVLLYYAPGAQGIGALSRLLIAFVATVMCMAMFGRRAA
jgi:hypothetical protein